MTADSDNEQRSGQSGEHNFIGPFTILTPAQKYVQYREEPLK